ncbi:hypothetical protein K438DRAFT_1771044 [Mycena galopus ATCC 62051]|nr:hypothetical protein K438DRAFT_1771044 [Mycena galopus ATCC 62051]
MPGFAAAKNNSWASSPLSRQTTEKSTTPPQNVPSTRTRPSSLRSPTSRPSGHPSAPPLTSTACRTTCYDNAFYDCLTARGQLATMFHIGSNVMDWPLEAQRTVADGHQICVRCGEESSTMLLVSPGGFFGEWFEADRRVVVFGVRARTGDVHNADATASTVSSHCESMSLGSAPSRGRRAACTSCPALPYALNAILSLLPLVGGGSTTRARHGGGAGQGTGSRMTTAGVDERKEDEMRAVLDRACAERGGRGRVAVDPRLIDASPSPHFHIPPRRSPNTSYSSLLR